MTNRLGFWTDRTNLSFLCACISQIWAHLNIDVRRGAVRETCDQINQKHVNLCLLICGTR